VALLRSLRLGEDQANVISQTERFRATKTVPGDLRDSTKEAPAQETDSPKSRVARAPLQIAGPAQLNPKRAAFPTKVSGCNLWNINVTWENVRMPRELVWLENTQFAAWGCSACAWIVSPPVHEISGKPSTQVKQAFNKHECARFPRTPRKCAAPKQ
jgi:hypothetical protein